VEVDATASGILARQIPVDLGPWQRRTSMQRPGESTTHTGQSYQVHQAWIQALETAQAQIDVL